MMPCGLSKNHFFFFLLLYGQHFKTTYHSRKTVFSSYPVTEKTSKSKKIVCFIYLLFFLHLFPWDLHNMYIPQVLCCFWMSIIHLIFQLCWVFSGHQWSSVCVYDLKFLCENFFSHGQLSALESQKMKLSWVYEQSILVFSAILRLMWKLSVKKFGFLLSGTFTSSSKPQPKYKHNHQNSSLAFVFVMLFYCLFLDFGRKDDVSK